MKLPSCAVPIASAVADPPARPEMLIKLTVDVIRDAVVTPTAAVQRGPKGAFVYVVTDENKAVMTPVTVSRQDEQKAMIASGVVYAVLTALLFRNLLPDVTTHISADLGDPRRHRLLQPLAGLGQPDAAGGPCQQPDAHPALQPFDGVAQGGLRDPELGGGLGEAALAGHREKRQQVIEVLFRHAPISPEPPELDLWSMSIDARELLALIRAMSRP